MIEQPFPFAVSRVWLHGLPKLSRAERSVTNYATRVELDRFDDWIEPGPPATVVGPIGGGKTPSSTPFAHLWIRQSAPASHVDNYPGIILESFFRL